jgi:GTP-binding protein
MPFIDEVEIRVVSGRGGDGAVSFRREKFVPFGGPDGGDGGCGGSVILVAHEGLSTLARFRGQRLYKAEDGRTGGGRQCTGRSGADLELQVPVGTLVRDLDSGDLLADLSGHGDRLVAARGGDGGRGNMRFATATNRVPRRAEDGFPHEERRLLLELRLLADVGVVGFPNAGKSTFVSRVSAARPRIADYPFTTLVPSLGVVQRGFDQSFVVADVPGLIEGAAEGAGLGHRFLRHVQRTRVLLHLVRAWSDDEESAVARYRAIRGELEAFDPALAERPEVVALSQIDVCTPEQIEQIHAELRAAGIGPVYRFSAVTGRGLPELLDALWSTLEESS